MAGSAPGFPHGVIDPIGELSAMALGSEESASTRTPAWAGSSLPWAERLGYEVAPFDFRLPGVTSMSADTHKYGYAAKGHLGGALSRPGLRHSQYYVATEWPGGLYYSPTWREADRVLLVATAWAAMLSMGESGYLAGDGRHSRSGRRGCGPASRKSPS